MAFTQQYPNTFTGQVTNQVTKRHDDEFKYQYTLLNTLFASDGHAHAGGGSDGAQISYNNLINKPTIPTTATEITNTPAGNIVAATVQAAINELDARGVTSGYKNKLINGDFRINQRGFAGGSLVSGYGHDRWKADTGGVNYSVSSGVITIVSGTLKQIIESPELAEKTITVSVENPSATVNIDVEGQTGTITSGSGRRGCTLTVPVGSTGDITLKVSGAASWKKIQLEEGAVASPFEERHIAHEMVECQRYYQSYLYSDAGARSGIRIYGYASGTGTQIVIGHLLPVRMRGTPTGTIIGTWAVTNCSQPLIGTTSKTGFEVYVTATAAGMCDSYQNTTDDGITFDAEL